MIGLLTVLSYLALHPLFTNGLLPAPNVPPGPCKKVIIARKKYDLIFLFE